MAHHKIKFIFLISGLLIAGFLITSLASFFVSRASLRAQIEDYELPLISDNVYSEIQRDIILPVMVSSFMANDTFLRHWVIDGEKDPEKITQYLAEIHQEYDAVAAFFVSEKTRNYYYYGGVLKQVRPEDPRDKWYFHVRTMDKPYEMNFDPDLANNDAMTIFVNHRVYDFKGRFIGSTGIGLTVKAVSELLGEYERKYDRNIYFTDPKGNVVLHSLGKDKKNPGDIRRFRNISSENADFLQAEENVRGVTAKGRTVFMNARFIPELGWYLVVEREEHGAIRTMNWMLAANLAICLFVMVVLIVLISVAINAYRKKILGQDEKLAEAMEEIDQLGGLIPICANCKKIRDDEGYWHQVEKYIAEHSTATFTHGICPECMKKEYEEYGLNPEKEDTPSQEE